MIRRNADPRRRQLHRGAEGGGPLEYDRFLVEEIRAGKLDYESAVGLSVVKRGPILAWELTWEFPGLIQLAPASGAWGDMTLISTPWFDGEISSSPLSVDNAGAQVPMRDLNTPNTGVLTADAEQYRRELEGAITFLSAAAAARAVGLCSCSTFPAPNCPTHGDVVSG